MIFITGDIHGDINRFSRKNFMEQDNLSRDDYMIILGDFGVIWDRIASKEEQRDLDILDNKPFTTLFIDGNHENHDRLNSFSVKEWHGGTVHEIRPNVLHLMRAQVYEMDGKSFFTFGGAASHDIVGCATKEERERDYTAGILRRDDPAFMEKKRHCKRYFLNYRIEGETWWRSEMPSQEEMDAGIRKLDEMNWKVDYVLTHECPTSTLLELTDGAFPADRLTEYLEGIKQKLDYTEWYSGHHHDDIAVSEKDIVLYHRIHRLADSYKYIVNGSMGDSSPLYRTSNNGEKAWVFDFTTGRWEHADPFFWIDFGDDATTISEEEASKLIGRSN